MFSIFGCVQKTNKVSVSKTEKPPVVEKGPPGLTFFLLNEHGFKEYQNDKDSSTMVLIPAGEFTMGSDDYRDNGKPIHTVYLDTFYIEKYEVTVRQYRKFAQATGRNMPDQPGWNEGDNYPVVNITWYDGSAYAIWSGKRLPTEAEWEKAARGTDERKYPWGDTWDPSKCNSSDGYANTTPVGSFPQGASPYGVMDMAGNVWEWCADWYDKNYYSQSSNNNPKGPSSGSSRGLRGGSWYGAQDNCRASSRNCGRPQGWGRNIGLRCVR